MKRLLLLLWLMAPLPVIVWHFGPGQGWLALDRAYSFIKSGQQAEAGGNWAEAEKSYRDALATVGTQAPETRTRLNMALVRTAYGQGNAVEAIDGADSLLTTPNFHTLSTELQREARELAGRIHYYAAWVMRLEGAKRELWMEEAEMARQNYRLLTESSIAAGLKDYSSLQQTNLESSVRLERMSMTELLARPLPEEGRKMSGQGLSEQMGQRRQQRGQQPGEGQNEEGPPQKGAGQTLYPGSPGS